MTDEGVTRQERMVLLHGGPERCEAAAKAICERSGLGRLDRWRFCEQDGKLFVRGSQGWSEFDFPFGGEEV